MVVDSKGNKRRVTVKHKRGRHRRALGGLQSLYATPWLPTDLHAGRVRCSTIVAAGQYACQRTMYAVCWAGSSELQATSMASSQTPGVQRQSSNIIIMALRVYGLSKADLHSPAGGAISVPTGKGTPRSGLSSFPPSV